MAAGDGSGGWVGVTYWVSEMQRGDAKVALQTKRKAAPKKFAFSAPLDVIFINIGAWKAILGTKLSAFERDLC